MLNSIWTTLAGVLLVAVGAVLENYGHTHALPGGLGDIIIAIGTALAAIGKGAKANPPSN